MMSFNRKKTTPRVAISMLLLAVAAFILMPQKGWAQTGLGSVSGVVRDSQQAVVPGAAITVINEQTNIQRTTTTNEVGVYKIAVLPLGQYRLSVEMTGFKKWVGTFAVLAGQDVAVNPVLELGELAATIEVTGAAPVINTVGTEIANVKDFERIRDLPLNGRSISNLFNLTPGVEGGGNARVNGLKVGSLEITLDGISLVDRFGGGIARIQPGLDTVQEFRIETTGSDARYSRPATVTLATRSGTNQFHGSAFETHRNNTAGLVARRRDTPVAADGTVTWPKLIRNEFGASAGGPVWLGKLYDGHDKTFWFFAYEGARQRESYYPYFTYTPTADMWNGNLSNIIDSAGNKTIIYDPLTTDAQGNRQPFPGNIIPSSRISSFAKMLQAMTDLPTDSSNPYVTWTNYQKYQPRTTDADNYTAKVDHALSSRDNLSARYTLSKRKATVSGGYFGNPKTPEDGYGTSRNDATVTNVSTSWSRSFTSQLLNQVNVGVHRSYKDSGTLADFTDWPKKLGLPNPFGVTGWPTMYAGNFAFDGDNIKTEALTGIVFEDNVSWTKGKHEIQFGAKLREEYNNVRELQQAAGSHNWGGAWTSLWSEPDGWSLPFTGDGFADLLLGLPDYLSIQYNRGFFYFLQDEIGAYVTDKWRVTPKLTLNLGLRWDKWTPYSEKHNRITTIDLGTIATKFEVVTPGNNRIQDIPGIPKSVIDSWSARGLTYTTASAIGYPETLFRADNNNFGPRIGLAYQLNEKTVIRGGYGEYFWTMPLSQILQSTRTNPPLNLRYENDVYAKNDDFTYPLVSRPTADDYIGKIGVDTQGIVELPSSARGIYFWDGRTWGDGRAQSWHATVERELMRNTVLRLSYLGDHGSNLEQRFTVNARESEYNYVARTKQAPPSNRDLMRVNKDWSPVGINRTGFSNANSAQVEIERRFSDGIAFQWFYTYTRALTTTDSEGFTSGNSSINSAGGGGQVPEKIQLIGAPDLSYDQLLRLVYFNSTTVPPHRIRYNANVVMPFGRGKKYGSGWNPLVNGILGGWQIALNGDWRSGYWMSPSTSLYSFGDPRLSADERVTLTWQGKRNRLWFKGYFDSTQAKDVQGGDIFALVPADRSQRVLRPVGSAFDNRIAQTLATGAIRQTSITEMYNFSPRANIMGPGFWNVDLGVYKNFQITEAAAIRFKADFFNAFNHPNDVNPNMTTGLQDLSRSNNDGRIIQFSIRIDW
ncbi:MAG: carboxypeptidase regulatory-like domain-containing protein [Acidobacteria bacterium]|nr:carboxypeptidase regulatory-like domain-containing protein [Acidobacteriota bacterium]